MKNAICGAALLCASLSMSTVHAQTAQPIPAWDHVIAGAARFVVLRDFGNNAVLDQETGLVWERSPTTAAYPYYGATNYCLNLSLGGRKGWRVPSIFELSTLLDTSVAPPAPLLPEGHPFRNVKGPLWFWSSTQETNNAPSFQWGLNTMDGTVAPFPPALGGVHPWCVRAPSADSRH